MKVATTQKNGVKDSRTEDRGVGGRAPCVLPTRSCCSFVDLLAVGYPWDSPISSYLHPTSKTPQQGEKDKTLQLPHGQHVSKCKAHHMLWSMMANLAFISCNSYASGIILFAKGWGKPNIGHLQIEYAIYDALEASNYCRSFKVKKLWFYLKTGLFSIYF